MGQSIYITITLRVLYTLMSKVWKKIHTKVKMKQNLYKMTVYVFFEDCI